MGGFEGGDEGGFWDEDAISNLIYKPTPKNRHKDKSYLQKADSSYLIKAHAKINIFLKIKKFQEQTPSFLSRVVLADNIYDTISFVPCECEYFTIEGCEGVALENNSIYKAYEALIEFTADSDIEDFFCEYKVVVNKSIPYNSGLSGASSDASAFIRLVKEACNLVLSTDELIRIAKMVSPDVVFFIYNYSSANVSDVIEYFEEEPLNFELFPINEQLDTQLLYQTFQQKLSTTIDLSSFEHWQKLDSRNLLKSIQRPEYLNDLYNAAVLAYPNVKEHTQENLFFSNSSFYKLL